jgi:dolichol-phosphate mannosyltransferase
MKEIKYSIIVPVFNEEKTVNTFYNTIIPVMEQLKEEFEIVYINDGSRDNTEKLLIEIAKKDVRVKVINFSRNFGQQAALLCGFKNASGQAVIDIDVDLQDPPEVIPKMIEKWKEGYDVVHGKRKKRKGETIFKKLTAFIYSRIIRKLTDMDIPKDTGDFKLFDRKVIDTIISLPEHNRFLRGITTWVGFKQTFVEFERKARIEGETKYTFKSLLKLATNGIVANSNYPLTLSLKMGVLGAILSILTFATFIILVFFNIYLPIIAYLFPTIAFFSSMTCVFNGLSNVYLARIYDEVKNRPVYIEKNKINFEE